MKPFWDWSSGPQRSGEGILAKTIQEELYKNKLSSVRAKKALKEGDVFDETFDEVVELLAKEAGIIKRR